ncbi:MAG TPA: response regulator transcription factor [Thermoanaerobaculia bacterium]
MIRIAIADDHPLFREGLRKALSVGSDLQLVGEAADGRQALALCAQEQPDVLVLDLTMPHCDGFAVLERMADVSPATRTLVLTVHLEREFEEKSLSFGARGFLQKDSSVATILAAVRAVAAGGVWANRQTTARILRSGRAAPNTGNPLDRLTAREREILDYLCLGLRNREIAQRTGVSEKTVATHVASLIVKLGVGSRVEAALLARRYAPPGSSPDEKGTDAS